MPAIAPPLFIGQIRSRSPRSKGYPPLSPLPPPLPPSHLPHTSLPALTASLPSHRAQEPWNRHAFAPFQLLAGHPLKNAHGRRGIIPGFGAQQYPNGVGFLLVQTAVGPLPC